MSNTRIIFFSILIAILLAILVMWCADVLAHGEGKCLTDADGNVPLSNGGWVKVVGHLSGAELRGYVHGHLKQYYDRRGNPTHQSTGFFSIDFDDTSSPYYSSRNRYYADCPAAPPPPPPPRLETSTESRSTDVPIAVVLERIIEDETEPEPEVDIDIPEPPVRLETAVKEERWEVQFYKGWNLVSFPVQPEGVETISDLYHRWNFFASFNADIITLIDRHWLAYSGIGDGIAGEIPLSPNLGLVVRLDWASWVGMRGIPLPNQGSVDLRAGVNLVGWSDLPPGVKRPSDLLSDVICAVIVTRRGELYLIGRAGDPGDAPLERGQAVILIATESTTLDLEVSTAEETVLGGWGMMKTEGN